jgi:hypothetical protein
MQKKLIFQSKLYSRCIYPATRRWANVPVPLAQSCTQFLGICNGFADSGVLRIAVEHITLSLGPHVLSQAGIDALSTTDWSTIPVTPARRRKYVAIGSTATPTDSKLTTPVVSGAGVNSAVDISFQYDPHRIFYH